MKDSRTTSTGILKRLVRAGCIPVVALCAPAAMAHDGWVEDHVAATYDYVLGKGPAAGRSVWAACALSAALVLSPRSAPACEICVEDHVAATYDYAVVAKAEAAGQKVLFVAVRGKDAAAPASEAAIRKALGALTGVDRASIRTSAFPSAASFAWNPKRYGPADLLRTVNGGLGGSGLTLVALKVIG